MIYHLDKNDIKRRVSSNSVSWRKMKTNNQGSIIDILWAYNCNKLKYLIGLWVVLQLIFSLRQCWLGGHEHRKLLVLKNQEQRRQKPFTQPTNATFFTLLNRPTFNLPTQGTKQYVNVVYVYIINVFMFLAPFMHILILVIFSLNSTELHFSLRMYQLQHALFGKKILHCFLYITPK